MDMQNLGIVLVYEVNKKLI